MRTASQDFADKLLQSPNQVTQFLKTFSWHDGYPLFRMALAGYAHEDWIAEMKKHQLPQESVNRALKILIAQGGEWEGKKKLAEFLVDQVEYRADDFLFHRAAVAGSHEFFPLLLEKDPHFNWDSLNDDGLTPLYLALDHGHLKSAVDILKQGGKESFVLSDAKGQKHTVLDLIHKKKVNVLKDFKRFWKTVHERYLLGDATQSSKTKKSKKERKM